MESNGPTIPLTEGINLNEILTTGSVLDINIVYEDTEDTEETYAGSKAFDRIGSPVDDFVTLEQQMKSIDQNGFVKKKILNDGSGEPPTEKNTITIAYSGYWEKKKEPFDMKSTDKPLVVDLKDHGLLPGLEMAIKSMLVGELSVFLLDYKVMYGELGVPPRIKPRAVAMFYIKLMKSIITLEKGSIKFSEPNMFTRVHREVKLLYSSGVTLYNANNFQSASNTFKKGINMLHKVRLADENEEKIQENLLTKLYINSAICYNKSKLPSKACICCNELNRLNKLWNNPKVLLINARALRMIGVFDDAEKRLKRALKLSPDNEHLKEEFDLLEKDRKHCNKEKLSLAISKPERISDEFKQEIDELVRNFKQNMNLCQLTLPEGLNSLEIDYIKQTCKKENVFYNKLGTTYALDREDAEED